MYGMIIEIGFYQANERSTRTNCNWTFQPRRPSSTVELVAHAHFHHLSLVIFQFHQIVMLLSPAWHHPSPLMMSPLISPNLCPFQPPLSCNFPVPLLKKAFMAKRPVTICSGVTFIHSIEAYQFIHDHFHGFAIAGHCTLYISIDVYCFMDETWSVKFMNIKPQNGIQKWAYNYTWWYL